MTTVTSVGGVSNPGYLPQEERALTQAQLPPGANTARARGPVVRHSLTAAETDDYVERSIEEVKNAYQTKASEAKNYSGPLSSRQFNALATPPAIAATEQLLKVTDSRERPYVTPEKVARVFQGLRTNQQGQTLSTMDQIISDLALDGDGYAALRDKENPSGFGSSEHRTYDRVIRNLSVALDSMGRAQDARTGQYGSPQIDAEVRYLGRQFAQRLSALKLPQNPALARPDSDPGRIDGGFRQAAREGSAILALETARQLTEPEALNRTRSAAIVNVVREGAEQYNADTRNFFAAVHQNLAPVLAPLESHWENLTESQQRAGVANIFKTVNEGDKLFARIQSDRREADARGYRLLRFGETVGLYKHSLGDLSQYRELSKARGEVLNSLAGQTLVLMSESATQEIDSKVGLKAPAGRHAHGPLAPTALGLAAQAADYMEYALESDWLKKVPDRAEPVSKSYGTYGAPDRRVPRYGMPADVAGKEIIFDTGEYRKVSPGAGRLDPGAYAIDPLERSVKVNDYAATRMGVIPKTGLAVWGVGGLAQAALTEYIVNEVGFAEGQGFRKALLVSLVGGFAAFHLAEAAMAGARSVSDHQPWTRFSVAGTTGVTGSLAALMTIATAWDLSGVRYNATASSNPDHGAWGSPQIKAATHSVNLLNDALLWRLQVAEFSKRILPGLIEKYGEQSSAVQTAKWWATSRTLSYIGTRFALTENPIGAIVNVLYGGTAVANFVVDRARYIKTVEAYDKAFLQGAGVGEMQAEVLKEHSVATVESRSRGFHAGYRALGAATEKFVDYVNAQTTPELQELIRAARMLGKSEPLPPHDANAAYYALPQDEPGEVDLSRFPTIHWNPNKDRFEDSASRLYYDAEMKAWRREDHMGDLGWYYYPGRLVSEEYGLKGNVSTDMPPTGIEGWQALLSARGKLPPQ